MTYTYNSEAAGGAVTTLHKVRLEIGDNQGSVVALFTDEEINIKLGERSDNWLLASADLCDVLAARFSQAYDVTTDGQSFQRSKMAEHYRAMAARLRERGNGGISTLVTTRVDGYSDDIANDEVGVSGVNPRRRYYGEEDRIP